MNKVNINDCKARQGINDFIRQIEHALFSLIMTPIQLRSTIGDLKKR